MHIKVNYEVFNTHICKLFLFFSGADIDALTQSQETPLMYAVEEGAIEAARCLLGKNANMNLSNADGQSILHIAAYHNQYDVLKVLLKISSNTTTTF